MSYQVFRNSNGKVDAINRVTDGATVPLWDEADLITVEFREWLRNHPEFDVSDHPPQPAARPDPNWTQFRAQMGMNSVYLRIATASPVNQVLNSTLIWLLGEIGNNPSSSILGDVVNTWNAMAAIARPTIIEVTTLNNIGKACYMPFELNAQGMMMII